MVITIGERCALRTLAELHQKPPPDFRFSNPHKNTENLPFLTDLIGVNTLLYKRVILQNTWYVCQDWLLLGQETLGKYRVGKLIGSLFKEAEVYFVLESYRAANIDGTNIFVSRNVQLLTPKIILFKAKEMKHRSTISVKTIKAYSYYICDEDVTASDYICIA